MADYSLRIAIEAIDKASATFRGLAKGLGSVEDAAEEAASGLGSVDSAASSTAVEFGDLGDAADDASDELDTIEDTADDTAGSLDTAGESAADFSLSLANVGKIVVPLTAAVRGLVEVIQQGIAFAQLAVEAERANRTLEILLGSAEEASGAIHELTVATGGEISAMETAQMATRALTAGFANNRDEAVQLIATAEALGDVMGVSAPEMFDRLTIAMMTGSVRALRSLGLNVQDVKKRMEELEETQRGLTDEQIASMAVMAEARELIERTADANLDQLDSADRLRASLQNLRVEVGQRLAPAYLKAADALNKLFFSQTENASAMQAALEAARKTADSYEEYVGAARAIAETHGYVVTETGELVKKYYDLGDVIMSTRTQGELMKQAMFDAARQAEDASLSYDQLQQEMADIPQTAQDAARALTANSEAVRALADAVRGPYAEAAQRFEDQQARLRDRAAELQGKIDELAQKRHFTPEQQAQLDGWQLELAEVRSQMETLADEHEKNTQRILYDMLVARLSVDGWTAAEHKLALETAKAMGLIDQTTYNTALAMDAALQMFAQGAGVTETRDRILAIPDYVERARGAAATAGPEMARYFEESSRTVRGTVSEVETLTARINAIPRHVRVNIEAVHTGPGFQAPRAYQHGTTSAARGWAWVGERGPELVFFRGGERVLPSAAVAVNAASGALGGAQRVVNTTNNYYLTVMSGRSAESVVQDFWLMRWAQ